MTNTAFEAKKRAEIDTLLKGLSPVKKHVQRSLTPVTADKPVRDFDEGHSFFSHSLEAQTGLKHCGARAFVEKVLMWSFGMGYDYAIEIDGQKVKSWFTVEDAVEEARKKGYEITPLQAHSYLSYMAERRYYEYEGGKYRRLFFRVSEIDFIGMERAGNCAG